MPPISAFFIPVAADRELWAQAGFPFLIRSPHGWSDTGDPSVAEYSPKGRPKTDTRRVGDRNPECVYFGIEVHIMRTNIVIDDKLMRDTLRATGLKTKREAVEEGLRSLLRLKRQAEIRKLRGKLDWQGDLDAMRRDG